MPKAASTAAPSAGPRTLPVDSTVVRPTFAAVSSSGSRTSVGSIAACAGQNTVLTSCVSETSATSTTSGAPVAAPRQMPAMIAARTASVRNSTRCFG